jgi:trehalose/maltose hydrolase-like predicted phosphorylase
VAGHEPPDSSRSGDGIISQFEGYNELEELDWDAYRAKYGNIQRLDRILRGG